VANYSISGVTISGAALKADGYTVTLTTSAMSAGSHSLTVKNVKTRALSVLSTVTTTFSYSTGGAYVVPPFTVGVNSQVTNSTSPALSGTISDPNASVSVRVNGSYYGAVNNGDGTWSLAQNDISALGNGSYDVVVVGVNTSGVVAFDSTVNELSVGTTSPTAVILSPTSPTVSPVNTIAIDFSEPVNGFTLQDLQLTLAVGGAVASEPLMGATLTTTDNQNWMLGNLSGLTALSGTYNLILTGLASTVTDIYGNPLVTNGSASWTKAFPAVQSISCVGSAVTNASSVQYAVTFNESVANVQMADFVLVASGASGTIASISGNGAAYTVTVNGVSGNGTLGLNLVDDNSIVDQYGDPLGGLFLGDGNFTGQSYTIDNTDPSITMPASAAPSPVVGTSATLSVLATDIATGAGSLTYSWAATTLPNGAPAPTFGINNGSNAAQNTTVTFGEAGSYVLTVTIADPNGLTRTSSVSVAVNQTLTSIRVNGGAPMATALDQFGNPLANQPAFDVNSETITGPLALSSNVAVYPSNSRLTISGAITGAGALTVAGSGTVVLTGANNYTGGTFVSAGKLFIKASAIATGTSLTVGAGASQIFASAVSAAPSTKAAAVTASVIASSVDTAVTRVVADDLIRKPHVAPAAIRVVTAVKTGAHCWLIARRIAADLSWLEQKSNNSQTLGQQENKDLALQALETAFAQYGC
jgi:autotransporter-associated beta strand protein